MKEKIAVAVYDENQLLKELLHHQLERMRFEVFYSTMNVAELRRYVEMRPVDVLLVNGENDLSKFSLGIKNIRKRKGKIKVIFYNSPYNSKLDEEIKRQKGAEAFFSFGGWSNLLTLLDTFTEVPESDEKIEHRLTDIFSANNPFYKISENQKYIDILRYLKDGKSNRQIAFLLDTSINNVKYHLKKLRDETGSNTTKMVADAIKAGLI